MLKICYNNTITVKESEGVPSMPDMLVNLYNQHNEKEKAALYLALDEQGIHLQKVLAPDKGKVLDFVKSHFGDGWAYECEAAFANNPTTCWIAIKEKQVLGFACYDATAKDFFGPTGVKTEERGQGIGKALLFKCLDSMKEAGYAYAIIGWAGPQEFYQKVCGATPIPVCENNIPSIYCRMIAQN